MANAKEIQDRMKSINDTLKITNAMYMISSSKLKKSKENAGGHGTLFLYPAVGNEPNSATSCRIMDGYLL